MSSSPSQSTDYLLHELQLLESYLNCMSLDIPMLNAAKSEREWDWFFHKLEEGFLVAEVEQDYLKLKLAKRFMRGRQLFVWCDLIKEAAGGKCYGDIRDSMYAVFFPQSDYYNSLMELFGGYRENGNESPRRKMSLVGVKLVIGTAKETMLRVSKRYGRDMPPESFWYQFAARLMTPAVKELFDSKVAELLPPASASAAAAAEGAEAQSKPAAEGDAAAADNLATTTTTAAAAAASTTTEARTQTPAYPDLPIEDMLNSIKDPNPRSMRAPHKFRRTIRKNRPHQQGSGALSGANKKAGPNSINSPSSKNAAPATYPPVAMDS